MGIGSDIKPKRVSRHKTSTHHDPFDLEDDRKKKDEEEEDAAFAKGEAGAPAAAKSGMRGDSTDMSERDNDEVSESEDDFFHDYNKKNHKPKKEEKEENSGGFLFQSLNARNVTWLLVLALLAIVIYQNFDSIKNIFISTESPKSNSNANETIYEGVSNSNSTNSNINSNANANVNANTNTAAAIDKSTITIQVLNGNGVAGSADKVAATLTAAGFTPAKSANARKFTYSESIIYYKTGQEASANLVKAALPNLTTTLMNSDSIVGNYDIIVVVGKK